MTTDDWQGRLGRLNLLVNARTAHEAACFAMEAGRDLVFKTERLLGSEDDFPTSISPPAEADSAAEPSGGGAWRVTVLRLGHATSSGSESSSDYFAHSIEFIGARPHDHPHANREPEHWRSVALAIDEKIALHVAAAPSSHPKPSRKPSL